MIRISQIDDELSIYKNNTVVLLGLGDGFKQMFDLLQYHGIELNSICDNNKDNCGTTRHGLKVISPPELKKMIECEDSNVVVQVAIKDIESITIDSISNMGAKSVISFEESDKILNVISFVKLYQSDTTNPYFRIRNNNNNNKIQANYILKTEEISPIFISQTQKTGDMTLRSTFSKNKIAYHFTSHNPNFFDKELFKDKTIKITTAIRDPIAKNISNIYQNISAFNNKNTFNIVKSLPNFFVNGGDAQLFFEIMLKKKSNEATFNSSIFMEQFKSVIDLSKFKFDKEKGYTIVKEGNIEVFVYQLEKMNDIVKEMSDWVGQTPFDEWVISNEASSKWIADSYKQALKEIKITQEYFNKCYDDPWIKHFYSDDDIEKFKDRWRPHIKD